jgi:hypothetical protein
MAFAAESCRGMQPADMDMPQGDGAAVDDTEDQAAPAECVSAEARPQAMETPDYEGYVDGLNPQWRVIGWARPLLAGQDRLHVQLVEDGAVLDATVADMFRGDLLGARIGDGQYGFSLRIPAKLFDGSRHTLLVRVAGDAAPDGVGTLDLALPNRAPPKALGAAAKTACEVLHAVLPPRISDEALPEAQAAEITQALAAVARNYDHATALGLLYVHVLRRRIDHDGLQTRLTRLSAAPAELATVVREVLASDEAKRLYRQGSAHRFPDISALDVWTRLRRSI